MLIHACKYIDMMCENVLILHVNCVRINMLMHVIKCVNMMWNYIKI